MKTENKAQNKLQVRAKLNIAKNMEFLLYKKYIISISLEGNKVDFYDMRTFKRKFYLKRKRHENNFYHEKWKLFFTKDHKVFLLGYQNEPEDGFFDENTDKILDIYLLKIDQRKCVKKKSFAYYKFIEDEKDDKLYILTEMGIIQYDFITGISNDLNISIDLSIFQRWAKFFLINNYFLIVYLQEVSRWTFLEYCYIIDKNSGKAKNLCLSSEYYYDMDDYLNSRDFFVQITDNFFSIYSKKNDQITSIFFSELGMNEKTFQEINDDNEYDNLLLLNEKELKIAETGKMDIYPINKKRCGIIFKYSSYYIIGFPNMDIIAKIKIKFKDELFLLKFIEDGNEKYKLFLANKNNLLLIE